MYIIHLSSAYILTMHYLYNVSVFLYIMVENKMKQNKHLWWNPIISYNHFYQQIKTIFYYLFTKSLYLFNYYLA